MAPTEDSLILFQRLVAGWLQARYGNFLWLADLAHSEDGLSLLGWSAGLLEAGYGNFNCLG